MNSLQAHAVISSATEGKHSLFFFFFWTGSDSTLPVFPLFLPLCLFLTFSPDSCDPPPPNTRCPPRDPHSAALSHLLIAACFLFFIPIFGFHCFLRLPEGRFAPFAALNVCDEDSFYRLPNRKPTMFFLGELKPTNSEWSADITFNNKTFIGLIHSGMKTIF